MSQAYLNEIKDLQKNSKRTFRLPPGQRVLIILMYEKLYFKNLK
jgi:hypothetical protein